MVEVIVRINGKIVIRKIPLDTIVEIDISTREEEPIKPRQVLTKIEFCKECGSKIVPKVDVHMHEGLCANCSRKYK